MVPTEAVGDQVIQFVAQNIKNQIRDVDLAARIGGDEIFVLLPETSAEETRAFAERIRLSIGNQPFIAENVDIFITLSLGVYRMPAEEDDFSSILVKIEGALHKAKQAGRNSVMLNEE